MDKQFRKRVIYHNWIVDIGKSTGFSAGECNSPEREHDEQENRRRLLIEKAVLKGLGKLQEDERELVERYYFMGESFQSMAERTGRRIHKIEALHCRALRKLKKNLSSFADSTLCIPEEEFPVCPVCNSAHRTEIDIIIQEKRPEKTWKEVIRVIRERFGIFIRTPQTIIGHRKYHN